MTHDVLCLMSCCGEQNDEPIEMIDLRVERGALLYVGAVEYEGKLYTYIQHEPSEEYEGALEFTFKSVPKPVLDVNGLAVLGRESAGGYQ